MLRYKLRGKRTEVLVQYAQAGFKEAMELIIEKYYPMVLKISSNYYAPWAEKEDIVQCGVVGLIKAVFYFEEGKSSFTSFAWRSVESEIKSFLTYLNRKKNKMLSDAISVEQTEDEESPEYEIVDVSRDVPLEVFSDIILEKVLERLKGAERDIFLKWLNGFSYKEIAEEFKTSVKKVDNTVQKARRIISELG